MPADPAIANVNGSIGPADRPSIPASDHGFLYGDSVYETVRTYGRRPFLMERHLERLERSAGAIKLHLPWGRDHITRETERTLPAVPGDAELVIRIVATRGAGPFGYDPDLCPSPNLVILVRPLAPPTAAEREFGVKAVVASVRRNPIEALDPRIKSSNLLNNILASFEAKQAGAVEAILLNTAGCVAEGTNTNVFFVKDGRVLTPSLECGILSGLTREIVIDLVGKAGLTLTQGRFRLEEAANADELFLTGTTREVLPVSHLDGRPVSTGRRGPVTSLLQDLFRRRVVEELMGTSTGPPAGG
ncbi:MAG TPA: aminotransferase class IV [Candidatus Polarisedimenticolia bacterium]|nr:aminotransferase class IV [Candidatus Polarisedimenticolia bacterium]